MKFDRLTSLINRQTHTNGTSTYAIVMEQWQKQWNYKCLTLKLQTFTLWLKIKQPSINAHKTTNVAFLRPPVSLRSLFVADERTDLRTHRTMTLQLSWNGVNTSKTFVIWSCSLVKCSRYSLRCIYLTKYSLNWRLKELIPLNRVNVSWKQCDWFTASQKSM